MTTVALWAEVVIALLALGGAGFTLIGSWGLAKLGDFAKRLHGPTKATTLGVGSLLVASMLWFGLTGRPSLHELLIAAFLFVTAPVSAQLLIKAALKLGTIEDPGAVRGATARSGQALRDRGVQRDADEDVEREGQPQRHAEVQRRAGLRDGLADDGRHGDV